MAVIIIRPGPSYAVFGFLKIIDRYTFEPVTN
jgi:hypothetical protein